MKYLTLRTGAIVRIVVAMSMVGLWVLFSSSELSYVKKNIDPLATPQEVALKAQVPGSIMPQMTDADAKKELGRVSWKYFHTLLARFPDEPTQEERDKLSSFLKLYAELYPCGECSVHFVKMLNKYPPQTSSRTAVSMWGCHIHNIVNEYLGKNVYDCTTILEDYDCGCGAEENIELDKVTVEKEEMQLG